MSDGGISINEAFAKAFNKVFAKAFRKDFVYPTYLSEILIGNSIAVWDRTKYPKDMPPK